MVAMTKKKKRVDPKPRLDLADDDVQIPVRMLEVVAVAAKGLQRYSINAVFVEVADKSIRVAATDGKRLLVADYVPPNLPAIKPFFIPREIVKDALRLNLRSRSGYVVVSRKDNSFVLNAKTSFGDVSLTWNSDDSVFPPYRDILKGIKDDAKTTAWGVNPSLLSATLQTIGRIVGKETVVRVNTPEAANRPIGVSATGYDITVTGCIIPMNLAA